MSMFPAIASMPTTTPRGVPYLTAPGCALIAAPRTDVTAIKDFLDGFDPDLRFAEYLDDPVPLDDETQLVKLAGQLCYMSFGPKRSWNEDADKYLANIKSSGHGSVLEHATWAMLFYGIDRAVTHEMVRHRVGVGFSQVSQRYVSGKTLRFVERPEWQDDPVLHERFLTRIEYLSEEYEFLAERLIELQNAGGLYQGENRTDRRKRVQQAARSCLPNETEAPILMSGNVRSWRHFLEMRCSPHADRTIRDMAGLAYRVFAQQAPILLSDYEEEGVGDGSMAVSTSFRKV